MFRGQHRWPLIILMKARIGVGSETGIAHAITTTAANSAEITEAHSLLHGADGWWGDADIRGLGWHFSRAQPSNSYAEKENLLEV